MFFSEFPVDVSAMTKDTKKRIVFAALCCYTPLLMGFGMRPAVHEKKRFYCELGHREKACWTQLMLTLFLLCSLQCVVLTALSR